MPCTSIAMLQLRVGECDNTITFNYKVIYTIRFTGLCLQYSVGVAVGGHFSSGTSWSLSNRLYSAILASFRLS